MNVLVINSGSSSVKFRLYAMAGEALLVSGEVERIGEDGGLGVYREHTDVGGVVTQKRARFFADHRAALEQICAFLEQYCVDDLIDPLGASLHAIGHRVVHGGDAFQAPVLIGADVIQGIRAMIPLAPLHNPASLAGIDALRNLFPQVPQVAVFDTAFFQFLPPHAYRYAVPNELYKDHHVRRYGFHGSSHQFVAREAADYLARPLETLRLITLHLGNGASASAILNGVCIDTSMGMTALEGLIMGTRCGDIDPALHFFLARTLGMDLNAIETLLNHDSGLKGLCGASDMREVRRLAAAGDEQAGLAIAMYCYRISKYVGAYTVALGGLDALVFTGGVGENDMLTRATVCERLSVLDIFLDDQRNQRAINGVLEISEHNRRVKVLVVPTNEELEIARQTQSVINRFNAKIC
tara:strand:- start:58565 stop:59797 length:1233 start_codon:yes stop_codon:yes gene_type:complete